MDFFILMLMFTIGMGVIVLLAIALNNAQTNNTTLRRKIAELERSVNSEIVDPHGLNLTRTQFREKCAELAGVAHDPCCDAGLISIIRERLRIDCETLAERVFLAQRNYGRALYALDDAVIPIVGSRFENWGVEQDSDYDNSIEIKLIGDAKITDEERTALLALGFSRVWNDERSARAVSIPLALEMRRELMRFRETNNAAFGASCNSCGVGLSSDREPHICPDCCKSMTDPDPQVINADTLDLLRGVKRV